MKKCNSLREKRNNSRTTLTTPPLSQQQREPKPKGLSHVTLSSPPSLIRFQTVKERYSTREMRRNGKLTGCERRGREAGEAVAAGAGPLHDVACYYQNRMVKNASKFALSYLDRQVFSWSVEDVFNRNLFLHKVTISSLRPFFMFRSCCLYAGFPSTLAVLHMGKSL